MAKFKTVVKTLDEVPAEHHDYYVEQGDGSFVLDVDNVDEHPTVTALKNALERQKAERRKIADELAKAKERVAKVPEDFDPDTYATMVAELEELRADPKNKGDDKERQELAAARKVLEQKIAGLEKTHNEAILKKDNEIKKRDGKIHQLLIDEGLTKALVEAGVGKEYLRAAKALLKNDCSVIEEDGDYRAVVESDMGQLDISKYVTDWVASDEGKVFVPPAKGGDATNSTKPSRPTNTDKNPWSKDSFNLTEQGAMIKEDRAKAEKLAKAAGKTLPPAAA